jgi:alginate biosynthesis protein Alg44
MSAQIEVETEVHRQHVRLNIPITVAIEGTVYTVDDWSMGGFGVTGAVLPRNPGDKLTVRLVFPFEDFELAMTVPCVLIYSDAEKQRFGCRYTALSKGQASLFRQVVDGYVSGEIVSGGDLLVVLGRDGGTSGRAGLGGLEDGFLDEPSWGERLGRVVGYLLLLLLVGGLGFAGWWGWRERYQIVRAEIATIETPFSRPRAPASGVVEAIPTGPVINTGQPFAQITRPDGSAVPIPSPCECTLLEWRIAPGVFAQAGDVVAVLASASDPLLVKAMVPFDRIDRIAVGRPAEIKIPGQDEVLVGQVERFDLRRSEADTGRSVTDPRLVTVWIKPDMPLPFDDLGSRVDVTFR